MGIQVVGVFLLLIQLALPEAFAGSNSQIVFQGRILKPDGTPLNQLTNFTFNIRSPNSSCILWSEKIAIDFTDSIGGFSVKLGEGTNLATGTHSFSKVFDNGVTLTSLSGCDSGNSYAPLADDDRLIDYQFNDGSGVQTGTAVSVKNVPFANQASSSFAIRGIKVSGAAPTTGQLLTFNSVLNQWEPGTPSLAGTANAGTPATPGISFSTDPSTGFVNPGPGTLVISTSGVERLRIDSLGNIGIGTSTPTSALQVIGTVTATAFVGNGSGLTGVIGTDPNKVAKTGDTMSGVLNLPANGLVVGTNQLVVSGGSVGLGILAPASRLDVAGGVRLADDLDSCVVGKAGTIRYNSAQLQFCNGSIWGTLGIAGASINSVGGATASSILLGLSNSGSAPAWSATTGSINLALPLANAAGVTAGLLSKSEYDSFAAKQSTALGTGSIWVGQASVATPVAISGDASLSSLGVLTLNTSGVTAGTYGGVSNYVPNFAVDAKGRITSAGSSAISINANQITAGTLNTAQLGIVIASDLSGILGVAKGGTGLNGSTAANGQLLIGNGSGYTLGTLNSSNGITAANSAGAINLSTNAQTTNAINTIVIRDGTGGFSAGALDLASVSIRGSVSGTATITAPSSFTNYGLTLPSNAGSSGQFLQTNGSGGLSWAPSLTGGGTLVAATGSATGPGFTFIGDLTTGIYRPSAGNLAITTAGTARVTVDGSGNVGIGTNNPGGKLDVQGGRTFLSAASEPYGLGVRYLNTGGAVYFGAANSSATPDAVISNSGGAALMTLLNGGSIGIGTSSPSSKLQVVGTVTATAFSGDGSALTNVTGTDSSKVSKSGDTISGNLAITGNGTIGGNVTLSLANPTITTGGSYITIPNGIFVSGGTPYFQNQIQARGGIHNDTATYLSIDGGTSGFTNVSGKLGVGNTAPSATLDVTGTVNATGGVLVGGTSVVDSSGFVIPATATAGAACSTTGSVAKDASGNLMVCN